jgi:hypothetical protein
MHRDQLLFFVVKSKEGHIVELEIGDQKKMRVVSHRNIWIVLQLKMVAEAEHRIKRQGGDHQDPGILKIIDMLQHFFRFMFTMLTHWTKKDQQYGFILWQVSVCKMSDTIRQE